ncbi:hypothetical protein C0Q70_15333 [Pomacea canaliculata]|uniref:Protection of telomeres protein 1 n=1 Tax=Pomacea canaliculata TaxID=400727 RepID=A0A2T7NUJ1_POMCA|nr:hypothetical protein C0Q70_15333 [Pomacea canaliculata]
MSKKSPVKYVSLKDASGRCNVFGVVQFCKQPVKTKGTDYLMTISITDQSLAAGDKLVCLIFHPSLEALPRLTAGDVIRFHRLKIGTFNDKPQGEAKCTLGCSWLVFGADTEQLQSSSKNFSCTDDDRQKKDMTSTCKELQQLDSSFLADVWFYDDHFLTYLDMKPAQFIKLCNLHAAISKDPDTGQPFTNTTVVELVIHRGTSYGRGIVFLSNDSPEVQCLKKRMKEISGPESTDTCIINGSEKIQSCGDEGCNRTTGEIDTNIKQTRPSAAATRGQGEETSENAPRPGCSHWDNAVSQSSPQYASTDQNSKIFNNENTLKMNSLGIDRIHSDRVERKEMENTTLRQGSKRKPMATKSDYEQVVASGLTTQKDSFCRDEQESSEILPDVIVISSGSTDSEKHASLNQSNSMEVVMAEPSLSEYGLLDTCNSQSLESDSNQSLYNESIQSCFSLPSPGDVCMLQTATGHRHINRTSLREILDYRVPYKFRVLAWLVDFYPNTTDVYDFVQELCPRCKILKKIGREDSEQKKRKKDVRVVSSVTSLAECLGGDFGNWNFEVELNDREVKLCSQCSTEEEPVPVELTYVLRMVLTDSSNCFLPVNLWQENATKFFNGIKPEKALEDDKEFQNAICTLQDCVLLHPSKARTDVRPLDCCIFSYSTPFGTNFQLFDTILA